jgi:hypothetical protein
MNVPKMCPHCGTKLVDPMFLYASLSAWFAGKLRTTTALHAYRCDNSHIFLVFDEQKEFEGTVEEARRSSVLFA